MTADLAARGRAIAIGAGSTLALLIFTQLVLPGGPGGNGTPLGILFLGIVLGLLNALVAAGLVLIYRSARIINFAQGALGAVGGLFAYNYVIVSKWPYLLAFGAGVVVSVVVGVAVELGIVRRFFYAPRLALTVITIALAGFLGGVAAFLRFAPIFPGQEDFDLTDLTEPIPLPFPGFSFRVGNLALDFGFGHVFAAAVSITALVGLGIFLRYTKAGVAVRAVAENAQRASLLGISVQSLSTLVWTIAALLSGLGVILTGTVTRFSSVEGIAPAALVPALAAAVIARLKSLPVAVGAAVAITVIRQSVSWSFRTRAPVVDVAIFLAIAVGLMLQRRRLLREESADVSTWRATDEVRPTPRELLDVTGIRFARLLLIAAGVAVVAVFPWTTSTGAIQLGGFIAINAIVILSLVVLTGWAGQVSLGQFALVSIGSVIGGALTTRAGVSFWIAVPLVVVIMAAFATLIGIPALRVRGLFLGVATFAFAFAVEATLFNEDYFGWLLPDFVQRPTLFLFDFEDERSMYYLTVVALALAVVVVTALRRSRTGRVLIAVRDNESNVASFGINAVRTRLSAFALSGALCGFAGVLLSHHQRAVTVAAFGTEQNLSQESLNIFLYAVLGGVGSVSGALLGGLWLALINLTSGSIWSFILGPAGILTILYVSPGGLTALAYGLRDTILKIIAQRRQIVVPSLFADFDPEALARKLIPLASPIPNSGLAAIPFERRYRIASQLYELRGRLRTAAARGPRARDAHALDAAAKSLGDVEQGDGRAEREPVPRVPAEGGT